jgi:REP element-mobilizing transposase RayT
MSERYKTYEGGLFFVTLTVVGWIDVFTRREYSDVLVDNLNYCIAHKGLRVYAYCIMPSHVHMIAEVQHGKLTAVMRDFKSYTAKKLIDLIQQHLQESRREWLLYMFEYYGKYNRHNSQYQFWIQNNHPIDLVSSQFIAQKVAYIQENPVKAGFVNESQNWIYSSANPESALRISVI